MANSHKETYLSSSRDNKDIERARRITQLALQLMNTSYPLDSNQIWNEHYSEYENRRSFMKTFARDREELALCGIHIEGTRFGKGTRWQINTERSFVENAAINASDAYLLEYVCSPLISDPTFPFAQELTSALAKVNNCFGSNFPLPERTNPTVDKSSKKSLELIQKALSSRRVAHISYTNARGENSQRKLCCYGIFTIRNNAYMVGASLGAGALPDNSTIKTYRISRISSIELDETSHYSIPDDFYTSDYILLPFQIGSDYELARFVVDQDLAEDFLRQFGHYGIFFQQDDCLVWEISIADLDAAVSWSIAHSLIPLAPEKLYEQWEARLKGVLSCGK